MREVPDGARVRELNINDTIICGFDSMVNSVLAADQS